MELEISEIINTDILVIGGGAAGLRAAIEAKKYDLDVMLTSESPVVLETIPLFLPPDLLPPVYPESLRILRKCTSGIPSPLDVSLMTGVWLKQ